MNADLGISMITIGVNDIEAAIKFYEGWGFKKSPKSDIDMCIFMISKSISLGIVEYGFLARDIGLAYEDKKKYNGFTLAINASSKDGVDELYLKAVALGAKRLQEPKWKDWAGNDGYSGYVSDLDGYIWELAYAPFLELDEKGILQV